MSGHAYVAVLPCGCYVAALVDDDAHRRQRRDDANEIRRWLLDGYTVERVTTEAVRTGSMHASSAPCPIRAPALPGFERTAGGGGR